MRLTKITALAAVATFAAAMAVASSAQANTPHNGVVEPYELGLYYSQGSSGTWVLDSDWDENNLANNVFPHTSVIVDNNTASYRSRGLANVWFVYTGAFQTGTGGCIPGEYVGNASITFRNKISSTYLSNNTSC